MTRRNEREKRTCERNGPASEDPTLFVCVKMTEGVTFIVILVKRVFLAIVNPDGRLKPAPKEVASCWVKPATLQRFSTGFKLLLSDFWNLSLGDFLPHALDNALKSNGSLLRSLGALNHALEHVGCRSQLCLEPGKFSLKFENLGARRLGRLDASVAHLFGLRNRHVQIEDCYSCAVALLQKCGQFLGELFRFRLGHQALLGGSAI